MLVHQSNRSCNCCGKSVDNNIIDIPFEEIKLSPFAVECDCGYFYEAIHYNVSFTKWRVAKGTLEYQLDNARSDYNREQEYADTLIVLHDFIKIELKRKKELVTKLQAQWDEIISSPIPDHLWNITEKTL